MIHLIPLNRGEPLPALASPLFPPRLPPLASFAPSHNVLC